MVKRRKKQSSWKPTRTIDGKKHYLFLVLNDPEQKPVPSVTRRFYTRRKTSKTPRNNPSSHGGLRKGTIGWYKRMKPSAYKPSR